MKYPGGHSTERFCEQFDTVVSLFDQWNDCERTVVLCALLKRIPYSNMKFLQMSIENNSSQAYNSQSKLQILENNSNNSIFLSKLVTRYKTFSETILFETRTQCIEKYEKKEDILHDILTYLPLLRPGNNEAKTVYMNLIPVIVEDCIRQIVSTELVQHIFSYLLIHPAITNEDRRSLSHWLRHLQEHISQGFSKHGNTLLSTNPSDLSSPYLTSSASSLSSSSWQTVAPPVEGKAWNIQKIQVTQDFCDELTKTGENNSNNSKNNSSHAEQKYGKDDHSLSFSKNGTEVLDFDFDEFKPSFSASHIGFECNGDFLTVPGFEQNAIKTRRSNSLTTATSQNACCSAENLSNIAQKPRSFSLSIEGSRGNLMSAGSETRLNEINKSYVRYTTHNVGMSNIGQWLKSLRLHKYVWLFSNLTYEQMLEMTESCLENLGVTKGARHKLVLCIQKLKERSQTLSTMEKELVTGKRQIQSVLEELTNIVLTPMKPVDIYSKDDVAGQFFKIVDYISTQVEIQYASNQVQQQQEDDTVNVLLYILEKVLHNEAFVAQTNQLREHKFKLSKIKSQFVPKNHYSKNNPANCGVNKIRRNSKHKNNNLENRKNSNASQHFGNVGNVHSGSSVFYSNNNNNVSSLGSSSNNYNKSSSYPNFNNGVVDNGCTNGTITNVESFIRPINQSSLEAAANALNIAYHHSLNSLLMQKQVMSQNSTQQQQLQQTNTAPQNKQKNEYQMNGSLHQNDIRNSKTLDKLNSSIGDINSRLEFLCLQMTEQAIN